MLPTGLVKDAKNVTSYRKGERRAVRKNLQRQAFIRSTEELAAFSSVIPSAATSIANPTPEQSQAAHPVNPTLPPKAVLEKGYAQENAFRHSDTAKRVRLINNYRLTIS